MDDITTATDTVWKLSGGSSIAENTDLNTIIAFGNYYCSSRSRA